MLILPSYKITQKNKEVSSAEQSNGMDSASARRISLISSDPYGVDGTRSLAFSYCLVSKEHDLFHGIFLSVFQQNFPGLLVCNARKREHARKRAINFQSDGRLGPFFCFNKTTRNMPWEVNLVDLTFL